MNIIHPIYIKPLYTELLPSQKILLTHHKGGGIGAVLGIVAAVAIPFAAPAIATAMVSSGMIAASMTTVASAVIGGALGAGLAAATGGNILMGAAGGALGGGIGAGGFSGIGSATAAPTSIGSAATSPLSASVPFGGGLISGGGGLSTVPAFTSVAGGVRMVNPDLMPSNIPVGNLSSQLGHTVTPGPGYAEYFNVPTPNVTPISHSAQLGPNVTRGPGYAEYFNVPTVVNEGLMPPSIAPGPAYSQPALSPQSAPTSDMAAAISKNVNAPVRSGPVGVGGEPDLSWGDRFTSSIKESFSPENLARQATEGVGKLALNKLSEVFVDEPSTTREEDSLLAERDAALAEQKRLSDLKESAATELYTAGLAISPLQRGMEQLGVEQERLLRAQQQGLRNINPRDTGAVDTQRRQDALNKSRLGGFAQGMNLGERERRELLSQGAQLYPTGSGIIAGIRSDITDADTRYQRMLDEQRRASDTIAAFIPVTGTETEEERKKAQEGIA